MTKSDKSCESSLDERSRTQREITYFFLILVQSCFCVYLCLMVDKGGSYTRPVVMEEAGSQ